MSKILYLLIAFFIQQMTLNASVVYASGSDGSCTDILKSLGISIQDAKGSRGFISDLPDSSKRPGLKALLAEHNIAKWGVDIYVKPTIEAARLHDAQFKDDFWQGLYIISDVKIDIPNASEETSEKMMAKVLEGNPQFIYFTFDIDPAKRKLVIESKDSLEKSVHPEGAVLRIKSQEMGYHFYRPGWAYPDQLVGVFNFEELWKSSTYKDLMRRARKLQAQGYTFEFSTTEKEFLEDMEIAANTPRVGQDTSSSMYRNPKFLEEKLTQFKNSMGFTIRVKDANGVSQGGIICDRIGDNFIDFSSTFYRDLGGIDFAKIGAVILFKRLEALGVQSLPIEMVSGFSASLKGKKSGMENFAKAKNEITNREKLPYDFRSPWAAPVAQ